MESTETLLDIQRDILRYQDQEVIKVYTDVYSRDKIYTDLDLEFGVHPLTGFLTIQKDTEAVRRALKNLILTEPGERPFNPGFGTPLNQFLFSLSSQWNTRDIEDIIERSIKRFEPRVALGKIVTTLYPDQNGISVSIWYRVKNIQNAVDQLIQIRRTR